MSAIELWFLIPVIFVFVIALLIGLIWLVVVSILGIKELMQEYKEKYSK